MVSDRRAGWIHVRRDSCARVRCHSPHCARRPASTARWNPPFFWNRFPAQRRKCIEGTPLDADSATPEEIIAAIQSAGVVGLGGAGFPTHAKLKIPDGKHVDTLVINGAECEPYLTTDHRVMLEHAAT